MGSVGHVRSGGAGCGPNRHGLGTWVSLAALLTPNASLPCAKQGVLQLKICVYVMQTPGENEAAAYFFIFSLFIDFSRANIGEVGGVKRGFCNHKHFWMSFHQQNVRESALLGPFSTAQIIKRVFFLLNAVSSEWSSLRGENGWRLKTTETRWWTQHFITTQFILEPDQPTHTLSGSTAHFQVLQKWNPCPLCTDYTADAFLIPLISLMLWNGFDWFEKTNSVKCIFTEKLLVNFTNNYKETPSIIKH